MVLLCGLKLLFDAVFVYSSLVTLGTVVLLLFSIEQMTQHSRLIHVNRVGHSVLAEPASSCEIVSFYRIVSSQFVKTVQPYVGYRKRL